MDRIKAAALPLLKSFIIGDCDLELNIRKRGAAPLGGGEVHFKCPVNRNLRTVQVNIPLLLYLNNIEKLIIKYFCFSS